MASGFVSNVQCEACSRCGCERQRVMVTEVRSSLWHIVGKMRDARCDMRDAHIADGRRAFEHSARFTTQLRRTRSLAGSFRLLRYWTSAISCWSADKSWMACMYEVTDKPTLLSLCGVAFFSGIQFAGFGNALTFQRPGGVHCRHYLQYVSTA